MLSCFRGKVSRGFHAPLLSVRNIQFLLTFSDGTLGAICWAFGETAADRATGAVFRTEYYRTTSGGELTHHLLATCCWLHSTFWILPILYLLSTICVGVCVCVRPHNVALLWSLSLGARVWVFPTPFFRTLMLGPLPKLHRCGFAD